MGKYSKFNSFKGVKWPWVNRKYKDTVFRLLFSKDRRALLDLYNAINNSHYDNPDELIVNTLESAIFMGMRNDLSFILDTSLNVYEHQSTKCPNIPLRCLLYVSSLYQQILDESSLYSSKRLQIPEPHFVVFYNGTEDFPEETSYKLSEMYEGRSANPELELTVKVLNINQGMNKSLMQSCVELNGYSIYVAKVREFSQTMNFLYAMLSGRAHDFIDLAELVVFLSDRFVWLMLPVMAIAGVFVSLSNVALVRREGRGLVNLLGVLASLAWVVACVAWRFVSGLDFVSYEVYVASFGLKSLVATGLAFAAALLVGTSLCAWLAARHVPSMPRDYLVILGCGLRADGSPTPLLAGRVDAARAFAQRQVEAGMPQPTFVPSGGKGDDERWAEAEAMRRYLVEQGVGEEHIIPEDQSTNTRENFRFSAEKIAETRAGATTPARVAFSTTNYHVFRSYVFAHEVGLDAEGIAAPTKLYFWPNAFLREFVGLLAARPVPIVLAFLLFSALYVAAEYVMLLG